MLVAAITAVSLPAAFAAFAGGQSILSRQDLSVSLSQAGVARAVIGSALYLALVGMLGLGLGALIRKAAGGAVRAALRHTAGGGLPAGLDRRRRDQVSAGRGRTCAPK